MNTQAEYIGLNTPDLRADARGVIIDPVTLFTLTLGIGGLTVLCMLHIASKCMLHDLQLRELKAETERLRAEYARRIAEMRRGREDSVEVITAGMPQETGAKKAA